MTDYLDLSTAELAKLINDGDGVQVAFALGMAPREETVSAEHHTVTTRRFGRSLSDHHSQFKAWTLPRQPCELVAEFPVEFLRLLLAIGRSCKRNSPVWMQMA